MSSPVRRDHSNHSQQKPEHLGRKPKIIIQKSIHFSPAINLIGLATSGVCSLAPKSTIESPNLCDALELVTFGHKVRSSTHKSVCYLGKTQKPQTRVGDLTKNGIARRPALSRKAGIHTSNVGSNSTTPAPTTSLEPLNATPLTLFLSSLSFSLISFQIPSLSSCFDPFLFG